jgi:hypothetical protein
MLRGKFKGKSVIRLSVLDEDHLKFEGVDAPQKIEGDAVVVHTAAGDATPTAENQN